MLIGEHEYTIDDKNRLTLPAKFRDSFAEGLVLTRGLDHCVNAFSPAGWEAYVADRLAGLDPHSSEARKIRRYLFAGATEVQPDKQGRVMVPGYLAQYAGLARDVVVAGVGDRLEIWDRAAWRDELRQVEGSAEDVADRLASQRD